MIVSGFYKAWIVHGLIKKYGEIWSHGTAARAAVFFMLFWTFNALLNISKRKRILCKIIHKLSQEF